MSDDDRLTDELVRVHRLVAQTNADIATAISQSTSFLDHHRPVIPVRRTHSALLEAYADLVRSIDRAEQVIDQLEADDHRSRTPRSIKAAHAERLEEQYDGPVLNLALQLLEANRREWLHWKDDTRGDSRGRRRGPSAPRQAKTGSNPA